MSTQNKFFSKKEERKAVESYKKALQEMNKSDKKSDVKNEEHAEKNNKSLS